MFRHHLTHLKRSSCRRLALSLLAFTTVRCAIVLTCVSILFSFSYPTSTVRQVGSRQAVTY